MKNGSCLIHEHFGVAKVPKARWVIQQRGTPDDLVWFVATHLILEQGRLGFGRGRTGYQRATRGKQRYLMGSEPLKLTWVTFWRSDLDPTAK